MPFASKTLLGAENGFDTNTQGQTAAAIQVATDFAVDHVTVASLYYEGSNMSRRTIK